MSTRLFVLLSLTALLPSRVASITEINHHNFDQLADGRSFVVVLFYSSEPAGASDAAIKALKKANKAFEKVEEVVFGRVNVDDDRILALRFDINTTPSIFFFPYKKKATPFFGTITASALVETVTAARMEGRLFRRIHMNEHLLGQHYTDIHNEHSAAREIKADEFNTEVLASKKYVLVSLYKDGCKEECTVFDMVSRVFRNEETIAFFKLNMMNDNANELGKHYHMTGNPTLLWFTPDDKKYGKIYGGLITFHMLVAFINEHTGADRDFDGRIHEEAGRIKEFDDYLKKHIVELMTARHLDHIYINLKQKSKQVNAPQRFIDYYLKIVEKIKHGRTIDQILEEENDYITKRLSTRGVSNKERDEWTKFRNIISGLVDSAAEQLMDERSSDPAKMVEEMLYHTPKGASHVPKDGMQQAQWVTHSHDEL